MKLSQRSTRLFASGLSIAAALAILLVCSVVEFVMVSYMVVNGFRSLGLVGFIFSLWNGSAIIALTFYILSGGRQQRGGYMEVSNYLNLNEIAKKTK